MAQSDVFALKNSGLETFLFAEVAEVGEEGNGCRLTVLSVLARLGLDPWAEAARLVDLPKAGAIASLTRSIQQMQLSPQALAQAQGTATRLVTLLPVNNVSTRNAGSRLAAGVSPPVLADMPKWLPMTLLCCALALGMGVSLATAPKPDTAAPATAQIHQ